MKNRNLWFVFVSVLVWGSKSLNWFNPFFQGAPSLWTWVTEQVYALRSAFSIILVRYYIRQAYTIWSLMELSNKDLRSSAKWESNLVHVNQAPAEWVEIPQVLPKGLCTEPSEVQITQLIFHQNIWVFCIFFRIFPPGHFQVLFLVNPTINLILFLRKTFRAVQNKLHEFIKIVGFCLFVYWYKGLLCSTDWPGTRHAI